MINCPKCGSSASTKASGAGKNVRECYPSGHVYVRPAMIRCPETKLWITQTKEKIMIKYNVSLKTPTGSYKTTVEIEDQGGPVQNNGAAIQAAMLIALTAGETVGEPLRVERV